MNILLTFNQKCFGILLSNYAQKYPRKINSNQCISGNSSQTSDGAAAVLMAKRSAARKHNLPVLGVLRGYAVVGVPPDVMGIGPAYAIPEALKKAGMMSHLYKTKKNRCGV